MVKETVVSDYGLELLRKSAGADAETSLVARDHVAQAYFGEFGSREGTEKLRNRIFWSARQLTGTRVLDIGTSEGILPILAAREGYEVTGIDINDAALDVGRKMLEQEMPAVRERVRFEASDLFEFASRGDTFDAVNAGEVIEHLVDHRRFFELCHKMLSADGTMILTTPFGLMPDPDHKVSFFPSDMVSLCEGLFAVEVLDVADGYIRFVGRKGEKNATVTPKRILEVTEDGAFAAQTATQRLLDGRRQEIRTLTAARDALRQEVNATLTQKNDAFAALKEQQAKASRLRSEVEKLNVSIEQKEEAIVSLREAVEQLRTKSEKLETELAAEKQEAHRQADEKRQTAGRLSALSTLMDSTKVPMKGAADTLKRSAQLLRYLEESLRASAAVFDVQPVSGAKRGSRTVSLAKADLVYRLAVNANWTISYGVSFAKRTPERKQEALLAFRYFDRHGKQIEGQYPHTSWSKQLGAYRYLKPEDFVGQICTVEVAVPKGAVETEVTLRKWSMSKPPLHVLPALAVRTVPPGARDLQQVQHDIEGVSASIKYWVLNERKGGEAPAAPSPAPAPQPAVEASQLMPLLPEKGAQPEGRRLKALSILDEISELNWSTEFRLERIDRDRFEEQIAATDADFVFMESCWKGNGGDWEYAFVSPGLKHANAQALLRVIDLVKERGLKFVFWNKEDPMHYERYLPISSLADVICTTDANKVSSYEKDAPKAKVLVLPFAANMNVCNPVDRFRKEAETVCFAGAYYSEGHEERNRQMEYILPAIEAHRGAIYDRYSSLGKDRYAFPTRYRPFIRPGVPFEEVVELYKSFKVFLNVNTIVDSPTMMSRRVYEIMATGTPVVSAGSKALTKQFGDLVLTVATEEEAVETVGALLGDTEGWERRSHLGYRAIATQHTYAQRAVQLSSGAGLSALTAREAPLLSVIVASRRGDLTERILENLRRQNYPKIEVIFAVTPDFADVDRERLSALFMDCANVERSEVMVFGPDVTLGQCLNEAIRSSRGEFIAKFDDDNLYFENYLSDLMIPFSFDDYDVVGKESYFCYLGGLDRTVLRFPKKRHVRTSFVAGDAMIMRRRVFEKTAFPEKRVGEDTKLLQDVKSYGGTIYSADHFNFIKWRDADLNRHTWREIEENLQRQSEFISDGLAVGKVRV